MPDQGSRRYSHSTTSPPSTGSTCERRTPLHDPLEGLPLALAMVFKLVDGAQKSWRRFDGHNQLPKVIQGVKFTDGIEVIGNIAEPQAQAAA